MLYEEREMKATIKPKEGMGLAVERHAPNQKKKKAQTTHV